MRVEFLGGVRTVTGSATIIEKGSLKILVDCGMFQGGRNLEERNWDVQSYRPKEISLVLLTHAHIDHSGLIPKIVKEGFRGKVICTKATFDLCEILLRDSAHIQEMEAEWKNRKGKRAGREEILPLYSIEDARKSLQYFSPVAYGEMVSIGNGVKVRFQDAGHILGSAIIELWLDENGSERKLVFSGDLGSPGQPFLKDPSGITEGDILFLESTYGNRLHKSREETVKEFLKIIQEALEHRGKVIIPAFAVERTQEVIYTLSEFQRKGLIPLIPIYIDSPLAISATEIFKKNMDCFDEEAKGLLSEGENPLEPPGIIYSRTPEESMAINEDTRAGIIISASGMCDAGRIKHHLKHHLWRENSHIVFIGYQGEGTIGRRIIDGARSVRLFGEEIAIRAKIHTLGGFSAHADQKGLLDWLSHFKNPALEVFVVHGEEEVSLELARIIGERFHLKAIVPKWRERKILFGPEEEPIEKEFEEREPPESKIRLLFKNLDRNYRRLRKKLKREKELQRRIHDPHWVRDLEDLKKKIEELESKL
ncbi:MAG: MBL fold metallo-hydrolase RNA specificity domain-containing protein [Thermodesulfobacteriota bacterium]